MSNQFEHRLAEQLIEYFRKSQPRGGQVLRATFHQRSTATSFADAVVDLPEIQWHQFETSKQEKSLPVISLNQAPPVFVVRVVPEEEAGSDLEEHYVTQSGATTMRDIVTDSAGSDQEMSLLMIYEDSVSLDTLSASVDLIEAGPLQLEQFRRELLSPKATHDDAEAAFLEGLSRIIDEEFTGEEGPETLESLSRIRECIDDGAIEELPELIADLPGFLREGYLSPDQFSNLSGPDEVAAILRQNREHRRRIHTARRPGRQFRSELSSFYQQEFIEQIEDVSEISTIDHTEAEKGELDTSKREFLELEVDAKRARKSAAPDAPFSDANLRQSIIAVADQGEVKLRAKFRGDIEGVPKCLRYPDSTKDENISRREGTLTATVEHEDSDGIIFVNYQIFVGNATTGGYPSHEFSVAIVPEEVYQILDGVNVDINVSEEAFVSHGPGELTLQGPSSVTSSDRNVTDGDLVDLVGTVTLVPQIPEHINQITSTVQTDVVNFSLQFQTGVSTADREEVQFPLHLAALADPEKWTTGDLYLPDNVMIDTDLGEIRLGAKSGVGVEEDVLPLLEIEEAILNADEGAFRRQSLSDSVSVGETDPGTVSDPLQEAYRNLFSHFRDRNTIPSVDTWDDGTVQAVEDVLIAYNSAVDTDGNSFDEFSSLQGLGRIESATTDKVWLTPFHPVMLAYGLRIARWRDDLVESGATEGFRTKDAVEYLNPTGLLPYLYSDNDQLLRGTRADNNALWATYSPPEEVGTETPSFLDRVISDQGTAFVDAFRILFELHPDRELILNVVNLGDLGPVVEGIFKVYGRLKSRSVDYPQILIRIYGSATEGESLQQFLQDDSDSPLRDRLQRYDDERVEAMRSNVQYVKEGKYEQNELKRSHMTIFQGVLNEIPGDHSIDELDGRLHLDALLPRESMLTTGVGDSTTYITGFSGDVGSRNPVVRTACAANALEAAKKSDGAPENRALKRSVKARQSGLNQIWDRSRWAVHIRPGVGLDFYTRSNEEEGSEAVMVHHSDQYDSSSPGYDVVTSTRKHRSYARALERVFAEHGVGNLLNAEATLSYLVAIDGQLILEIQRGNRNTTTETVGFVGALAIEQFYLSHAHPDYAWFPTSIDELVGHDVTKRSNRSSLITYESEGEACDDLCFVGLPRDDNSSKSIKLWLVEAKGSSGNSDPSSKGVRQIKNGVEELKRNFQPAIRYADDEITRAVFGNFLVTSMDRFESYGVFHDQSDVISSWKPRLLNGDFDVEFLSGDDGTIGDVVVVGSSPKSRIKYDEDVRVIELPATSVQLLDQLDALNDHDEATELVSSVIPDLKVDKLL